MVMVPQEKLIKSVPNSIFDSLIYQYFFLRLFPSVWWSEPCSLDDCPMKASVYIYPKKTLLEKKNKKDKKIKSLKPYYIQKQV